MDLLGIGAGTNQEVGFTLFHCIMVVRRVLVPRLSRFDSSWDNNIALSYIGSTPDSGSGEIGSIPVRATGYSSRAGEVANSKELWVVR